ncbi:hypothetical protein [Pseudooceanicola nanhaiensis]|nr:hypothetical protein [Pseudooceanicola nanhaiensis]
MRPRSAPARQPDIATLITRWMVATALITSGSLAATLVALWF